MWPVCLKFEVCLARSRWCTRRDNHKSKLLTSCFRPISWQPQKRDNAEIAILMWARFAAFFYKKNSWKAHAHQASYLAEARARVFYGFNSRAKTLPKKVHWACEKTAPFVTQQESGWLFYIHTKNGKKIEKEAELFYCTYSATGHKKVGDVNFPFFWLFSFFSEPGLKRS